jgi:hypothetical protein
MTQHRDSPCKIFISYAHSDIELISPELKRLDELGLSYWLDKGISLGYEWREEVEQAISRSDVFLFFVSNNSVVSNQCLKELNFAESRDKKIFPVFLEETNLPLGVEMTIGNTHSIWKQAPDKVLYQAPGMDESCACNQCPYMRLNTLDKLYLALRDLSSQVEVDEPIRVRALVPIERMLSLS